MENFIEVVNNVNLSKKLLISNYNISSSALFISLLKENQNKNIIIFVPDRETGLLLKDDIDFFYNKKSVIFSDISKFFPFSPIIKTKDYTSEIIHLLYKLLFENNKIFIIPFSIILKTLIPSKEFVKNFITIKKGETIDRELLSMILLEYGYENSYLINSKGEFSFRGDILDIFVPIYEKPLRITLWDDYIEEINFFNIETQKRDKNNPLNEFHITQNTLFLYSDENINNISEKLCNSQKEKELAEKLSLKNIDLNISLLSETDVDIFDYIDNNNFIISFFNQSTIIKNHKNYIQNLKEHFQEINSEGYLFCKFNNFFKTHQNIEDTINKSELIFTEIKLSDDNRITIDLHTKDNMQLRKKILNRKENHFEPLIEYLNLAEIEKLPVYFIFNDSIRMENIYNLIKEKGFSTFKTNENLINIYFNRKKGVFFFQGKIHRGFKSNFFKCFIISEQDIFGKTKRTSKIPKIVEHSIEKFSELKKGDYVVHIEHGIGRYKGLESLDVGNVKKEFILIEYLNNDKLYVPIDRLNFIQKYVGEEGHIPTLDKLGSDRWIKVKERAKKAAESIAKELLNLYAERKIIKGISFKGNDDLIEEFSIKWEYEETDDQRKAIEEIFYDMEQEYPMDRLLCGDVGYGKTEVAIRAILKAVLSGYQVAFLVPTTILALQHYNTLLERFKEYPFEIAKISRFETKKEQDKIIDNLKNGKIDIIIGTHRLLQKDVKFKNLGFLIIDEEHKFGVKHKEKIKLMKKNLDVLSMTATPIPRTLQMSFLGVKDLSIINIPPADRQSIETHIIKFNKNIIKKAILKELKRDGQIYFVHNRVKSIYAMAKFINNLVPEAKIAVAHGQMDRKDLEIIYRDFINKKYNILVCTTIIESGLDNPYVNTIFINNADRFGISQLYQLRGRVGRSNVKAYAYFIISSPDLITPLSLKRLKILQNHSGLSQGFKLAMSDLEIRGAGNLFGEKQSGHILSVGFEYYMDILEQAINKLKGKIKEEKVEPEINYNFSAFIPENYIEQEKERLYIYKKLSLVESFNELENIKAEIIDRFGKLPSEMLNLFEVFKVKILLKKLQIEKVDITESSAVIIPGLHSKININKIVDMVKNNTLKMVSNEKLMVNFDNCSLSEKFKKLENILNELEENS